MAERDSKTGRFAKGHKGMGGRPSIRTLTEALRDVADPDAMAAELVKRSKKSDAVLMYIFNRLEGQPRQSAEVEHKGAFDVTLSWGDGEQA